jgi:putative PIN family toxin of toxin-antitoxin system
MQKIILDTNVVVSALIQKSFPYLILYELYLEERIELCVSENLMAEYFEVLNRNKFLKFPDFKAKADAILTYIANNSSFFIPSKKVNKIKDPDDNMILELALECAANFIITGNSKDFTISKFRQTKIVSPKEYWENYKPE